MPPERLPVGICRRRHAGGQPASVVDCANTCCLTAAPFGRRISSPRAGARVPLFTKVAQIKSPSARFASDDVFFCQRERKLNFFPPSLSLRGRARFHLASEYYFFLSLYSNVIRYFSFPPLLLSAMPEPQLLRGAFAEVDVVASAQFSAAAHALQLLEFKVGPNYVARFHRRSAC